MKKRMEDTMMKKNMFRMMAVAMVAFAMTACTNDDTLMVQPEKKTVKLNLSVGNYPAAQWEAGVQTRADQSEVSYPVGIPDPGKREWTEGDVLYTIVETNKVTCVTSTYTNGQWVSDDVEVEAAPDWKVYSNTYYAPGFHFDENIKHLVPNDENSVFSGEFMEANFEGTMEDFEKLVVNFNQREYGRIRLATKPGAIVEVSADNLYPVNGDRPQKTLSFTADENGNAFLYGKCYENEPFDMVVTTKDSETEDLIRKEERIMKFDSKAGQGYVLNLRNAVYTKTEGTEEVIWMEDYALYHEISAALKNHFETSDIAYCSTIGVVGELAKGLKDFDGNALVAAEYALKILNDTKTSNFQDLRKLEKVIFAATSEVGENSFKNCTALKEVYFELPITKLDPSAFENVDTENLVIYLSEDQKELVYDAESRTYVEGARRIWDFEHDASGETRVKATFGNGDYWIERRLPPAPDLDTLN